MKKFLLTLILILQAFSQAFALENNMVINLHTDGAYILETGKRPSEIQVTNPRIMKAEIVSDIFNENSEIVLRTYEEGISYLTFKIENQAYTAKILIDDKAPVDEEVIEIDKVKEH